MCKYVDKNKFFHRAYLALLKVKEPKKQTAFYLLAVRADWCWVWLTADVSKRSIGSLRLESSVSHLCRGSHQSCHRRLPGVFLRCYCGCGDHWQTPALLCPAEPLVTTTSWMTGLHLRWQRHRAADEPIGSFLCDRQGHPVGVRTHLKRLQADQSY